MFTDYVKIIAKNQEMAVTEPFLFVEKNMLQQVDQTEEMEEEAETCTLKLIQTLILYQTLIL